MSLIEHLLSKAAESASASSGVEGHWQPIRVCLDEDSGEFFNVGVLFKCADRTEVRMLDSFDRVKCLFGNRLDQHDLLRFLGDLEETIREEHFTLPRRISDTIILGEPLYASGDSPEDVVDEFFNDVVTLGRQLEKSSSTFKYRHGSRVRDTIFQVLSERMVWLAPRIIQNEPYEIKMPSGRNIEVNLPLLFGNSAGAIASAWYKSPIVAENNILQASSELLLLLGNTDISNVSLSVLVPSRDSGLSLKDFNKLKDATEKQLDRLDKAGVTILEAASTDALAGKTVDWWEQVA